jgi:transposase
MPRYKYYNYDQAKLLAVSFHKQILPGTFEYTLSCLIDHEVDLSPFEVKYKNDDTGAPAYDPAILLKIVLFAYSRGIFTSRKITQACYENIIFMALSADTRPHFTTIADFNSQNSEQIAYLFLEVLLICDEMDLIGKNMFAIDGCKMPSNASKERSGTKEELLRKKQKMEKAVRKILKKHRQDDHLHGVIQGYDGVAAIDDKHQIIVHAEAFGQAQEHDLLEPMIQGVRDNLSAIGNKKDAFKEAKLTADAGFQTEENMKMIVEQKIDGYVADINFRKRDPRFKDVDKYKERSRKEKTKKSGSQKQFTTDDFKFAEDLSYCICPAGKRLYRNGGNTYSKGLQAVRFMGPKCTCVPCRLRKKCLRHPQRTQSRTVAFFTGKLKSKQKTFAQQMIEKIDPENGRAIYSKRIGTVEPVFAHLRHAIGLNRFALQGSVKVNIQWKLYSIVHNLLKIHRFGLAFGAG